MSEKSYNEVYNEMYKEKVEKELTAFKDKIPGLVKLQEQVNSQALNSINSNTGTSVYPSGWDYMGQSLKTPWDHDYYKQHKPTNPIPPMPGKSNQIKYDEFEIYLKSKLGKMIPKKSAFEEVIDTLFSAEEKREFLINMGYKFVKDSSGIPVITITDSKGYQSIGNENVSLNQFFLKEITIKFKNLLLTKQTLKLKI